MLRQLLRSDMLGGIIDTRSSPIIVAAQVFAPLAAHLEDSFLTPLLSPVRRRNESSKKRWKDGRLSDWQEQRRARRQRRLNPHRHQHQRLLLQPQAVTRLVLAEHFAELRLKRRLSRTWTTGRLTEKYVVVVALYEQQPTGLQKHSRQTCPCRFVISSL